MCVWDFLQLKMVAVPNNIYIFDRRLSTEAESYPDEAERAAAVTIANLIHTTEEDTLVIERGTQPPPSRLYRI